VSRWDFSFVVTRVALMAETAKDGEL